MPFEPDHRLLISFVAAQERGDTAAAAELWQQLAINNFDRVRQIVKAFQFSPGRRLPADEVGSAVSEAFMRVIAMGVRFRKSEPGSYYAALYTCVHNACYDYGRKELRHQKRSGGSFDQRFEPGGESGPFDKVLADYDADRRRQTEDALDAERRREDAETLVAWALGQITNDNHREVLEMTYLQQLPADAIAEQLDISMANLYQRRHRGNKNWRRSSVPPDREQILSEFIDAWNAGARPDVDDYLARAAEPDRAELADELVSFMTFAPTPAYSDEALAAIRAEPIVAEALGAPAARGGLLPALLVRLRERCSWTTPQVADGLARELGLQEEKSSKVASYLEQLERRELDPSGVSSKVFEALGRLFGVPRDELEGAADIGGWLQRPVPAPAAAMPPRSGRRAMAFRAPDKDAAEEARAHLDLLAEALSTAGIPARDEVDDLFLGGR